MGKLLLNLVPGEPLALVQELASYDNLIQLDLFWQVFLLCVSMIRYVVSYSMESGFNSVGVSCSAMFDVCSNGGKYGQRWSILNTGCRPRNWGMLNSKTLSPIALVKV